MDSEDKKIRLQLRTLIRNSHNILKSSNSDGQAMAETLKMVKHFLPITKERSSPETAPLPIEIMPLARRDFLENHLRAWLGTLLQLFSMEWISKLPKGQVSQHFDAFFLEGVPVESFIALTSAITLGSQTFKIQKCTSLLEALLAQEQLSQLIYDQCELGRKQKMANGQVDQFTQQNWHELITLISTVPERVTNKLRMDAGETFYPEAYIEILAKNIMLTLEKFHDDIQREKETSLQFVSQLVGKLCIMGYGGLLWGELMPILLVRMENDFVWSRIMENVLSNVPDITMEATITPMIEAAPWYGTLGRLLGNMVLTHRKLEFLLTNKLLLLRHYTSDIVPQNIIGYLATSPSRKHLFFKVLESLVSVWGEPSAVKHTSYTQHHYLSRSILIGLAFLTDKDAERHRSKWTELLISGMQSHLDSPLPPVRRLGMIVAENVTRKLDQKMSHSLSFEYEKDEEVEHLLSLLSIPVNPGILAQSQVPADDNSIKIPKCAEQEASITSAHGSDAEELDSDDDLEPYDLSNDSKVSKVKTPVYVRDCMEGLLSSEDADTVEASLNVSEKLIKKSPSTVKEVAVEFTKILLHLDDRFSLPAFIPRRHLALVALATTAPKQVAEYLTTQFYDRNYNIRQRLDMLEVLATAARELSRPEPVASCPEKPLVLEVEEDGDESPTDWRQIVQQRIDAKTRRFASGSSRQIPLPETPNRFASVAGYFFFPLLKNFDRPESTLDLLGTDHLVLSRLLYTLGVVMHCAVNTQIVRQMGAGLLEFTWAIRFHPQPAVRQGALFALSMVVLSLPSFVLVSDTQREITEAKSWLEDIVQNDPDKECQKMALQALVLIQNAVKDVVL